MYTNRPRTLERILREKRFLRGLHERWTIYVLALTSKAASWSRSTSAIYLRMHVDKGGGVWPRSTVNKKKAH